MLGTRTFWAEINQHICTLSKERSALKSISKLKISCKTAGKKDEPYERRKENEVDEGEPKGRSGSQNCNVHKKNKTDFAKIIEFAL